MYFDIDIDMMYIIKGYTLPPPPADPRFCGGST
jgi:hypothetical protein